MIKKILLVLGIVLILFLSANWVVALVPSVREAIEGMPLQDQIFFLANEIDAIKARQDVLEAEKEQLEVELAKQKLRSDFEEACYAADKIRNNFYREFTGGPVSSDIRIALSQARQAEKPEVLAVIEALFDQYIAAKAKCDRLTEEYQDKYGD